MPAAIPDGYLNPAYYVGGGNAPADTGASGGSPKQQVIDGTPARVAVITVASVAVLVALRWGGFRFNVAVSN